MAVTLNVNGVNFSIPEQGDKGTGWGTNVTNFFSAVSTGMLQKQGGSFTLTGEIDFGGTYGIMLPYVKSKTADLSSAGFLRLAQSDTISWRNAANDGDLSLSLNSDALRFNGINLQPLTTDEDILVRKSGQNVRLPKGSNGEVLGIIAGEVAWTTGAAGDVLGPSSSVDNTIARYNSTSGKLIQTSGVVIDDSDNVSGVNDLDVDNDLTVSGTASITGATSITGALSVTSQSAPGRFKQFIEVKVADMTSGAYVYQPGSDVKAIKVTGVGGGAGGGSAQATGGSQVSGGGLGGGGSAFIKWYKREDLTPNPIAVDSANIDNSTDTFTFTAHGFETGREVRITTSDTLPIGLAVDTSYYIIRDDADTFKLASSRANAMAGTQIDITSDGVGNQTVTSHGAIHAIGVVGAGGAGGSAAGANGGGAGGATNFKIAQADGAGESFAVGASANSGTYFASGTTLAPEASGGDLNMPGSAGPIDVFTGGNWMRAMSGASPFAGSVRSSNSNTAVGEDGKFPGGGGSNARNGTSQSGRAGGAGADGVIWIEEFY